jgi:capsular polysaccharide biosynthesis protein
MAENGTDRSWRFRLHRAYRSLGPSISEVTTVSALAAAGDCEWIEIEPAAPFPRPMTRKVGGPAARQDPLDMLPDRVPAAGVIRLDGVHVDGHHGWVLLTDRTVVADCSWFGSDLPRQTLVPRRAPLSRHLRGTTLSLCTEFAYGNYGHVLYDLLPRLDLFERSGITLDQVDTILCNVGGARRRLIEELGIPMDKVVWTDHYHSYRVDHLIATTFPGVPKSLTPWAAQFLRTRLRVEPDGTERRLYIPRRTIRIVENEHELLPILERNGFEVFDPSSTSAGRLPRSLFASATAVVGGHGAGLADIIFSPPGVRLFELLPTDHPEPYFIAAAAAVGADHRHMTVSSTSTRDAADHRARDASVIVDVEQFELALDELVAELP